MGVSGASRADTLVILRQLHVLLRVLRLCCKRISNLMDFSDEAESEGFYSAAVPIAVRALALSSEFLKVEYNQIANELRTHAAQLDATTAPHTAATNACASVDPHGNSATAVADLMLTDLFDSLGTTNDQSASLMLLNNIAHMCLKCLWPIVSVRTPRVLCDPSDGQGFDQLCTALIEAWRLRAHLLYDDPSVANGGASLVPIELQLSLTLRCAAASQAPNHRISFAAEGNRLAPVEFAEIIRDSSMWRLMKWIVKLFHNFQLHFGLRNKTHVDKAERPVAERYLALVAPVALPLMFLHLRWHHTPGEVVAAHQSVVMATFGQRLTSPSAIRAIEFIEASIDTASLYHGYTLPWIADSLLTKYLLERLSYAEEDHDAWRNNPEEYVRAQSGDSVMGKGITIRAVAMSCILKLVTEAPPANAEAKGPRKGQSVGNKKDPEGTASTLFFNFITHIFGAFQTRAAARAAGTDTTEGQLAVDACMYAVAEMRETILSQSQMVSQERLESILTGYVYPELTAAAPFLRARAVRLLSLFTRPKYMQWCSPEAYQTVLRGVLDLLKDAELPVRMQACFSLAGFIQHPYAKAVVTPIIVPLIEQYFSMMKEMDSDRVIRTLRKTIHCYADTLSQWAVQLCEFLVQHFSNLYRLSLQKSAEEDQKEDIGGDIDRLAAGGGANPASGGPDVNDVLDAADELIETIRTLVSSLPKNEGPTASAELGHVFQGIQRAVLPMVLHLLHAANPIYIALTNPNTTDNGEGTSSSFLDALLGLVTLLIEQSNLVVPEMWEVFSGLQGLVIHGSVADYFGSIIAPMDNAITVDVEGFLSHSGRSWKDVNIATIASGQVTSLATLPQVPLAQLLADMCDKVLLERNDMRLSEMAAAPRIIECVLLRIAIPPAGVSVPDSLRAAAVRTLTPSVVRCAMGNPNLSLTFTYLLAMAVFDSFLVHTPTALAVLSECGLPSGQFVAHIVRLTSDFASEALSEADGSGPQILQMRQLHIIASVYAHLTSEMASPTSTNNSFSAEQYHQLVSEIIGLLQPVIPAIMEIAALQTNNMISYAQDSLAKAKSGKGRGDKEDSEDEDEGDSGDGDEFADEDGDSDEDENRDGGEFADMDTNNVIQRLAKQAQALNADLDDDDEDEDFDAQADENQLEDFEASSVIDKVDVWQHLGPALAQAGAGADLLGKVSTLSAMFLQLGQLTEQVVQAAK
eukprot:GILJ01017616.1.p1 GENE.GILJ01017616.1~~GILJ01017616.1.p1  ORF type:complete len:1222 (+),score=205.36 GILJ01017616.1:58-3666(+)